MKHVFKKLLCFAMLLSSAAISADCSTNCDTGCTDRTNAAVPYYAARSQSVNTAMRYSGLTGHIHLFDMEKLYGTFAITPAYFQTFRSKSIASCLFSNSLVGNCCDTINVSGSLAEGLSTAVATTAMPNARTATDWLADNFYLPTDFKSSLQVEPKVQSALVDLDLYLGLDEWYNGLYFRINAPITWTKYDLNMCESVTAAGTNAHRAGYFTPAAIERTVLLKNFTQYATGKTITVAGTQFEPLRCAKMVNCDKTETGLADLRTYLGWNFVNNEDYHFGLNVQVAAPTGNTPDGEFLFEPIVGNGNHWELGGGLSGHSIFWRSEDEEKNFGFYVDLNLTHLFKARQKRCFDLCGKPMSRYMLAAKFAPNAAAGTDSTGVAGNAAAAAAGTTQATYQFANAFAPVANLTATTVKVSVGVQADLSAFFNYTSGGFGWDVGYNLWARSCEKIKIDCKCPSRLASETNTWGLKGDAEMFGFVANIAANNNPIAGLAQQLPIALSATNSAATIFAGSNRVSTLVFDDPASNLDAVNNPNIDNPEFASAGTNNGAFLQATLDTANPGTQTNDGTDQIRTSIQSVLLSEADMDVCNSGTRGISHKVFTHFSYNWIDKENFIPYIGFGASGEFGNSSDCDDCDSSCSTSTSSSCSDSCDDCPNCALSQWGVWVKGGVSF